MLTIAYYFLQVVLCSALLMGYYLLVLRNKRFHQYNRFYILAVALLSWTVPLVKIRWGHAVVSQDPQMIRLLSVVANNNSLIEANVTHTFQWSGDTLAGGLYFLVAGILLTGMLLALYKVYRLLQQHSCKNVDDVYLVLTNAKGTPFSFFRYIFWNEEIDMRSESGKQILQHELTHVRQKHSVDKIFIQLVLVAGWFNPFFWLLKREMEMIHEFIADKKAVDNGDTASLAQMLLTAAYPKQQFALTNPFFFSPIRRRLKMLTNNTNPRFSYVRRLIVLPLLAMVVILFSFRNKQQGKQTTLCVASVINDVTEAITHQNDQQKTGLSHKPVATNLQMIEEEATAFFRGKRDTNIGKLDTITLRNGTNMLKWAVPEIIGMDSSQKLRLPIVVNDNILYVLDGEITDRSIIWTSVNPNDIGAIAILKGESSYKKYGEAGKYGAVVITTKSYIAKQKTAKKPMLFIDGVRMDVETPLSIIDPDEISAINIYVGTKEPEAKKFEKYGEAAKDGIIDIRTTGIKDSIVYVTNQTTGVVSPYTVKKIRGTIDNDKVYAISAGRSSVKTGGGSFGAIDGITDVVIVNGKRMSPEELNSKYKPSDFVMVAAKDSSKQYGKGVLLLSSIVLTKQEVERLMY